jgi:hypothetical protein
MLLLLSSAPALAAPQVRSVELVCLEHLDVGFTASPQEIARRQKEHLDHAIALCRERPDFRWTVESIWQLEEWLARTPEPAAREQLVALVNEGRIEVQAGFANLHTGAMDAELLLRCFEPADAIRRDLGIAITSCVQDDVPGFCALLPTAMAGSGVRYFLAGINTTFGGGTSLGLAKNPFWWEGLDGSRVLTWIAYGSYVEAEKLGLGVWTKDEESEAQLSAALELVKASGYARPRLLVMASTGDNGDPDAARSILRKVDAWNAKHEHAKVSFTTPAAFLSSLERDAIAETGSADGGFPVARGDWSGHWEPVKNSAPAGLALFRDAETLLPGCEALSLRANRELGLPYPQYDLDVALRKLLLCAEHSWPGGVGWPNLTTKAQIEEYARFDYDLAADAHETVRGIVDRLVGAYAERSRSGEINEPTRWIANAVPFGRHAVNGWSIDNPTLRVEGVGPKEARVELFVLPSFSSGRPLAPLEDDGREIYVVRDEPGVLTLATTSTIPDPEFDPLRVLGRVRPFGGAPIDSLRFTTAAGVIGPEDFLPGALPRSFCTSGCLELSAPSHGDVAAAEPLVLALREPFCFQVGEPGWLGDSSLDGARDVWIQLFDRAVRGQTKDCGVVPFVRLEPTPASPLRFHVESWTSSPTAIRSEADAELMRGAWSLRCPLLEREIAPSWFTGDPALGTKTLVELSDDRVLPLQLRPARTGDPADVILTIQEIGGVAIDDVEVRVALADLAFARPCDLLERPIGHFTAVKLPLHATLRPHEVANFRLSRR